MAFRLLKSLLGREEGKRPARVPTDEVLPVYDFDARPQVRDIIIGWTLRFEDILDADKLHVALSRLLEIGDWKKLGGRLRERVSTRRTRLRSNFKKGFYFGRSVQGSEARLGD